MCNVALLGGKEIIEANDVVTFIHQPFTHVRAEKASTAGYKNSL